MVCAGCGASVTDKKAFCPACGRAAAIASPDVACSKGVGGWLLLLCILLSGVLPANVLYGTVRSLAYRPDRVVLAINATTITLAVLSLLAGVMLWGVKKRAVTVAKIFLISNPVHAVAVFCLIVTGGHLVFRRPLVSLALRVLTLPFLISLGWYWYLLALKRVKNTYGTN